MPTPYKHPEISAHILAVLTLLSGLCFIEASTGETLTGTAVVPGISQQERAQINPMIARAYQYLQQNEPEAARTLYQNSLQQQPSNRDALLGLAAIAALLNDRGLALYYLAERLEFDPHDPQALAGWFDLSVDDGKHESRLQYLLNQHPTVSSLHFTLGNIYARQSRWSEARQSYENACQLDPANPAYNLNLAISLDHLGKMQTAARRYREAIRLNRYHHAGIDAAASARLQELPWP